MSAIRDFLKSEWEENERAIARQEEAATKAAAKEKLLRELRAALDAILAKSYAAKKRMETTPEKAPEVGDGQRIGTFVVGWFPWVMAMNIAFEIVFQRPPHIEFGLPLTIVGSVLAWYTPEIVFKIKERSRVSSVRNQAQTDHDSFSRQAEQIRLQIKAAEAEK